MSVRGRSAFGIDDRSSGDSMAGVGNAMQRKSVSKIPHLAEDASEFTVQPPWSFRDELTLPVGVF
jgi:hypothetical protein